MNREGGHVFPFDNPVELNAGMTLRTYIATRVFERLGAVECEKAAREAVRRADALVRELQEPYEGSK